VFSCNGSVLQVGIGSTCIQSRKGTCICGVVGMGRKQEGAAKVYPFLGFS